MTGNTYRRLGELLVEHGFITDRQLSVGLAEQRATGRRLGDILVDRGFTDELSLARCLADQYRYPIVNLESAFVDPKAARELKADDALALEALPFAYGESGLSVALADPLDVQTTDRLQSLLRKRLVLHIAPSGQLRKRIRGAYGLIDEAPPAQLREAKSAPKRFADVEGRLRLGGAVLFDATDTLLGRPVSLIARRLPDPLAHESEVILRAAAAAADPRIAAVYDLIETKSATWTVCARLPEENLGRVIRVRGPRPIDQAADIVARLAESVDPFYREPDAPHWLCPENVFLGPGGPVLAPLVPAPDLYRVPADETAEPGAIAAYGLGMLLKDCLQGFGASEAARCPAQMRAILEQCVVLGDHPRFDSAYQVADALRSYSWLAVDGGESATMAEREALLNSAPEEEEVGFWKWLFGRRAA